MNFNMTTPNYSQSALVQYATLQHYTIATMQTIGTLRLSAVKNNGK
jgi:hypothetical protein